MFSTLNIENLTQEQPSRRTVQGARFAVAAIRPSQPGTRSWKMEFTPTGFTARNVSLRTLTEEAFNAYEPGQLVGGTKWFDKATFDVEAKIDPDEQPNFRALTLPERRSILKDLLEQRFQLEAHREERHLSAFALVAANRGVKLHETEAAAQVHGAVLGIEGLVTMSGPGVLEGTGLTSGQVCELLTGYVGRVVTDQTGLTGRYDIALRWNPGASATASDGSAESETGLPSIETALREQLGLRLVATRSMTSVVVVDKAELPSSN